MSRPRHEEFRPRTLRRTQATRTSPTANSAMSRDSRPRAADLGNLDQDLLVQLALPLHHALHLLAIRLVVQHIHLPILPGRGRQRGQRPARSSTKYDVVRCRSIALSESSFRAPPAPTRPTPGLFASPLESWPSKYAQPHVSSVRMFHWTTPNRESPVNTKILLQRSHDVVLGS